MSDSPSIKYPLLNEFVLSVLGDDDRTQTENALLLYYAVRDGIRYDPFNIRLDENQIGPELCLAKGSGHCIDKAVLFVSACRLIGIQAKLGMARVQNHLGAEILEKKLGTNILVPHGYAACLFNGEWVKCTPAFNASLCEKLNVPALDWDGKSDSLFQAENRHGGKFMEYLDDYGLFEELPIQKIRELMQKEYPERFNSIGEWIPLD